MAAEGVKTVDVAALTERVLRKYPAASLSTKASGFDFASGDLPADAKKWDRFRTRGFMTLDELIDLSRWKTGGRQDRNIERNSDVAVRAITGAATSVASQVPEEPALPIGILSSLSGVDLPTASTVMTVWSPERFGILDIRAWNVLRAVAPAAFSSVQSPAGNRRLFRLAEADLYLRLIREIAQRASMSCRAVDQALWVLGEKK
mgnify:CR=1 FL=1